MNLRLKVFLSVGGILIMLCLTMYMVVSNIFLKNFQELETSSIEADMQRVSNAFDNRIADLTVKISDWGQWDDTYEFAQTQNPDYVDSNLQDTALVVLHIEYIVITDNQGQILFKKQIDANGASVPFSEDFERYIQSHRKLTEHADNQSTHAGIISLPEGSIITVSRAITSSDGTSPTAGTILFAFSVNDKEVQKLSELTQQNITIKNYSEALKQSNFLPIDQQLSDEHPLFIQSREVNDRVAYGYTFKKNLDNEKALIIRLEAKRDLYQKGKESILIFTIFMAIMSLLMMFIVLYLFERLVLKRLFSFKKAVQEVGKRSQENKTSIYLPGKDEFSALAQHINAMLSTLYTLEFSKEEDEKNFLLLVEQKNTELSKKVTETEKTKAAIMNLLEDIQEEKEKAENILQFLESIHEAVYVTDTERKIIFVNPAAAAIMGKSQEELLGTHTTEHLFFQISKGEVSEKDFPIRNALLQQKPLTFPDHTFVVNHEKHIPVAGTAAPIFDENNTLIGVILVFQDITEKYDLEQMKESFLSVAAHQLRTPLGSMRWSMELLLNGDLGKITKDAKEVVTQLYENSQRMLTLVNDLLDVSRIDQKRGLEEEKAINIVTLFEAVTKILSGEAAKRAVQIFIKPVGTIPPLVAAEKHLYEAFENILANSIKYNKEGGTVTIALEEKSTGIHIEITDTGIGIPEAAQQKMFSRFFRASNAVLKETEGSGLGLFVVKSYLEEAGATIRFESTENIGTTFFIDFPKNKVLPQETEVS